MMISFLNKNSKPNFLLRRIILLGFIVLTPILKLNAQDLSLKISRAQFSIGEISYNGYSTSLDAKYSKVKKEWWRYVKKIALLENHKTHYIITFLANNNESNTALSFVVVIDNGENSVMVKTALVNQEINSQFKSSAKNLLFDFKMTFYTSEAQREIVKSEKEAYKISQEINGYRKKIAVVEYKKKKGRGNEIDLSKKIQAFKSKQDNLIIKLAAVQKSIAIKKKQLNEIK